MNLFGTKQKNNFLLLFVFFITLFILSNLENTCCAQETNPLKTIQLPDPNLNETFSLKQSLKNRQSNRAFSDKEIPLETLSNLLWAAFGINRPESGKRTAPSAMNDKEIDIYVATKQGLYLYYPEKHQLILKLEEDIREASGEQAFTQIAAVNLIYIANFDKMSVETEADKIFYSAVDTGVISQNVYLFCASEGLATVVLGWVDKPALAKKMQLKDTQRIILTQPVGHIAD